MPTIKRVIDVHFSVQHSTFRIGHVLRKPARISISALHGFTTRSPFVEIEIDTDKFVENAQRSEATEHAVARRVPDKLDKLQAARANLLALPAPPTRLLQSDVIDAI